MSESSTQAAVRQYLDGFIQAVADEKAVDGDTNNLRMSAYELRELLARATTFAIYRTRMDMRKIARGGA
jgi:hypothetical protein